MQKINWIILSSKDRGTNYGVGTFINQFSIELSKKKDIAVFVLEMGLIGQNSFEIQKNNGITYFKIEIPGEVKEYDSKNNLEKKAKSIVRVIEQYIPISKYTIVHMNFLFQIFIAKELKEKLNGKLIFTQHVFTMESEIKNDFYSIEYEAYKNVDGIVSVTKHGKEHLIAKGINKHLVKVIYNGINPKEFQDVSTIGIKEKYGLPENEWLILYSGRIDHIKGLHYLSSAFEMLLKIAPNCRLIIAGDGDYNQLIRFTKYFSSKVSYLGFIPFKDIIALYHISDIGVIPSLEEHCSYVALEMLHCGLPVVASSVGGLKEIFDHDQNALLVDTEVDQQTILGRALNIDTLSTNMYSLLENNTLRNSFSQNAIIKANKYFTANKMVNKYYKTYVNIPNS